MLDDHGVDLPQRHAARCFKAEKPTANDDGTSGAHRTCDKLLDVVEVAKAIYAGQFAAGDRRNVRARAETEHQLGIFPAAAEMGFDRLSARIDADDRLPVIAGDARLAGE